MSRPSHVELNGQRYLVTEAAGSYRIVYESAIINRRVEAGGERGERELARSDVLVWRWDTWEGGEGQRWVDTRKNNTFQKYLKSGGAVDIRRPGQVRLGLALTEDLTISGTDSGPHLVTAGRPVVAYSLTAGGERWNRREAGTWGTAAATGNGATVVGQIDAINAKVFIGSTTDVVRVNAANAPASGTTWNTSSAHGVLVADNKLYFGNPTSGDNFRMEYVDIQPAADAPFTKTTVGTIAGWDQPEGLCADGKTVYQLASASNEAVTIFAVDGQEADTFREFARLPDAFRIPGGQRRHIVCLNGVVFVGGYFHDPHGDVDDPALFWADGNSSGIVGRIRERGNNERITCLFTTIDNEVLMGTDKGRIFSYNMNTGGFYEFASENITTSDRLRSMCYDAGQFFFSSSDGTDAAVWATKTSGTGKYPASVKIEGSRWDFDVPYEDKVLLSVTISGNFPTNTSAEFSFEMDDGSEVTTDSAGATMTANTTGDTQFTISDADTERLFKWAKPNITLKTSDTSVTPIIHAVTLEATTAGKAKFIEMTLDLSTDERMSERHISGAKAATEIEALIDDSTNRVITLKPFYENGPAPFPRATDTHNVIVDQAIIDFEPEGEAEATLRCRVV